MTTGHAAADDGLAAGPGQAGPPSPAGEGGTLPVAARPAEYETATLRWVHQAVHAVMRASDPLYAQLRPETVESIPRQMIDLGAGRQMPVEPFSTTVHGAIDTDPLISGDLGGLHAEICSIATQQLEQMMRAFFSQINDITQQTGNAVDANGDVAEGFLQMLETMDIAFPDDGSPPLQLIVSAADADRIRRQLAALTPDQMQRLAAIIARKQEAYRASRRHRRLPRLGY